MIRPECEQHHTPARDNQYRATARYYKDSCSYCEIDRLKAELEASTDNYSSLYKEWADSQKQLAEARAENELIKLLSISNKTYQCNYCGKSQCVVAPLNKEEIRQEAARECAEIATNRYAFELAKEIRIKFKLEG